MATVAVSLLFAVLSGVNIGLATMRGNGNLLLFGIGDGVIALVVLLVQAPL